MCRLCCIVFDFRFNFLLSLRELTVCGFDILCCVISSSTMNLTCIHDSIATCTHCRNAQVEEVLYVNIYEKKKIKKNQTRRNTEVRLKLIFGT